MQRGTAASLLAALGLALCLTASWHPQHSSRGFVAPRIAPASLDRRLAPLRASAASEPAKGEDEMDEMDFENMDDADMMMMPPEEVLDEWEADEIPGQILTNFQDPELEGKQLLKFRDVYRLLEILGLEKDQFVDMFTEDESEVDFGDEDFDEDEDEEDVAKMFGEVDLYGGAQAGGSRGPPRDFEEIDMGGDGGRGRGRGGGGRGRGGGRGSDGP